MNRAVDLAGGRLYAVTDLHGDWNAYARYRDHFLSLHHAGQADTLLFLGDVLHGYGTPEEDYSLQIIWDIMQMQADLGAQRVILLLGNHELPHIYGITLSKGNLSFTPRFEHALGEYRRPIIDFLKSLPFIVRTPAGVMFSHAGAAPLTATPAAAQQILNLSHDVLLAEGDELLTRQDVNQLLASTFSMTPELYARYAWEFLAVNDPTDPRYFDFLRGLIIGSLEPEWSLIWEFFFTQCEKQPAPFKYERILEHFLAAYSHPETLQKVLVTGHIQVKGGYEIIAGNQLRVASWAHAQPKEAGSYLLFDSTIPVETADDLAKFVYPMP